MIVIVTAIVIVIVIIICITTASKQKQDAATAKGPKAQTNETASILGSRRHQNLEQTVNAKQEQSTLMDNGELGGAKVVAPSTKAPSGHGGAERHADPTKRSPPKNQQRDKQVPKRADAISDWVIHTDPKSGRTYYYNTKTRQSQWEPPAASDQERSATAKKTSMEVLHPTTRKLAIQVARQEKVPPPPQQ